MKTSLTFLFFLTSYIILAQTIIRGKLVSNQENDIETSRVLELYDYNNQKIGSYYSNQQGFFELKITDTAKFVAPYRLDILSSFYEKQEIAPIYLSSVVVDLGEIFLINGVLSLQEVNLVRNLGVTQVGPQRISYETIDLPSQVGGSAGDVLKLMPSVAMGGSPNHNRDIRFRGLGKGFTNVLINGKPVGSSGNNRETVLDLLASGQIESIEILSNPTADVQSDGINGVVNIKLKKGNFKDKQASISFLADSQDGHNASVSLGRNFEKMSFGASYEELFRRVDKADKGQLLKFDKNSGDLKETQPIDKFEDRTFDNKNFRAFANFKPDEKLLIETAYNYGEQREDKTKTEPKIVFKSDNSFKDGKIREEAEIKNLFFHNPSVKLSYLWKGLKINASVDANFSNVNERNNRDELKADSLGFPILTEIPKRERELDNSEFQNWFPELNLSGSIGKTVTYKVGYQGFLIDREAEKLIEKFNFKTNLWESSIDKNSFDLTENTHAFFVTTTSHFKKLKVTAGLRFETTNIDTQSVLEEEDQGNSDYNLALPSLQITYDFVKDAYLTASVGRRVRRPGFNDLNPFVEIKSTEEIRTGSPDLDPEKAWAYEIGAFTEKKWFNVGVNFFYRDIEDLIQKRITDNGDGTRLERPENFSGASTSGLEFVGAIKPFKWWSVNANYSRFWSEIDTSDGDEFDGEAIKDQFNWTFKAINDFNFYNDFSFQIVGNWVGAKGNFQESEKRVWFVDLGLSHKIFKNGTFLIRVSDLFDTLEKDKTKNTLEQVEHKIESTDGRILSVGLSWNF